MGKPFSSELDAMPKAYGMARKFPIGGLVEFVKRAARTPLYAVGSGGSFSAAVFASLLHQGTGTISKAVTPMEFSGHDMIGGDSSVLIVTAMGNNADALAALKKAAHLGAKNIGILCTNPNGKIIGMASGYGNVTVHAVKLPTGRDGFLATNTLVASTVWLARAYAVAHSSACRIPRFAELGSPHIDALEKFRNVDTIVLLHDYWGRVAAVDAESKLIEAGLANIQVADYRNFAHGRYNWLGKGGRSVGLLALVSPHCEEIASRTLDLVSSHEPTVTLRTGFGGPVASIDLLVQIMRLVGLLGTARGIDPGMPKVAHYGRGLYHMPIPGTSFK